MVAALSGSHLLIEDVPGVGKTVLARALAVSLGVQLSRVQGHPDLLPSDVTGVTVFAPDTRTWDFRPGPVFAHVVLLDELNRTPPRTQSALLEAMEEQQVSVDGESWPLPRPHLVIGTQNPVGQLGTYPLVESQLDRFGLSTSIGYPDAEVEARLVLHNGGRYALDSLEPVSDPVQWERTIRSTAAVRVAPAVADYAVALVRATRSAGTVRLGASPRAGISLIRSAQAYAVLGGRGLRDSPGRPGGGRPVPVTPPGHRARRLRRHEPHRPHHRRDARSAHVIQPGPSPRPPGWRTVKATASGIMAGVGAAVLTRATLGRGVVLGGIFIGLAAMAAGASGSLFLTAPGRRGRPGAGRRRVHPVSWFTPVTGSVVTVLAWALVAHSSGSGWVQAVGAALAAVLAVGIVGPALPARRASVTCTSSPSDGQAGRALTLTVRASGPVRITPRTPPGAVTQATGSARGARTVAVRITPGRRGVARSVALELATCAPFGLLWWAKDVEVALPRPLHVAPRPAGPGAIGTTPDPSPGRSRRWVPAGTGEPRGTRPYRPGDRRGSVHWPSTSHVGALMVKETRAPDRRPGRGRPRPPARSGRGRGGGRAGHDRRRRSPAARADRHPRDRRARRPPPVGRARPHRPRTAPGPGRPGAARDPSSRRPAVTIWQRIVQANRPGPAEHSIPFRTASAAAVIVAVAACWSQQELSPPFALFAMATTVAGNVLSYRRRERPWKLVKPVLAVCAVGGFVWFIGTAGRAATPGDIATVEQPLAVLFAWVLCTHAFDVPSRRDVAYSLAGSAALMAVAAAQSVDLALAAYVVLWVVCGVWALVAMWQSVAGVRGVPWRTALSGATGVVVLSVALVALLPAPHASTALVFPSASVDSSPVGTASRLTDGAGALPAHAASAAGRTGVGGYLGFARSLDTGVRASLGDQVVMRVRAGRPNFWVGQTYDRWDGQSWTQSSDPASGAGVDKLEFGSPFAIPLAPDQVADRAGGAADVQTFYLAQSGPNLVFHADDAQRVYIQSRYLFLTGDGTIVSATSMGAGTVYTVVSDDTTASAEQLRRSTSTETPTQSLKADEQARYLQLPHAYPRVAALARRITAGGRSPRPTPTTRWPPSSRGWHRTSPTRPTSRRSPGGRTR